MIEGESLEHEELFDKIPDLDLDGVPEIPDSYTSAALMDIRIKELKLQNKSLKNTIKQGRQNRKERKKYAKRTFNLLCVVVAVTLLIVVISATPLGWISLSDSVLIALISSMALEVIGLFTIVMKYLYPNN